MFAEIKLITKKHEEFIDVTSQLKKIVENSGVKEGLCNVYCQHSSAAILIQENEDPNIFIDIMNSLSCLVPEDREYLHDKMDGNAKSHVKATLLPTNHTIPIKDGKLLLGKYQDLYFCEFDGPRPERKVIVTIISTK